MNHYNPFFKFVLFIIASATSSFAFGQQSLSLEEAINYAQSNSNTVRAARLSIADAEAQILESKSIGLPQLSFDVNYIYNTQLPQSIIPETVLDPVNGREGEFIEVVFGLRQNFTAGLNANWLALDRSYFYALEAARLARQFRQQELEVAEQEVRNEVEDAYLQVLIVDENLEVLEKNITNVDKLYQETKAIYEEGFAERLDVARLELSLSNLKSERDNLNRQREIVVEALKFTLNYPLSEPLVIEDDLEALFVRDAPEELTQEASYDKRPEYDVAKIGLELQDLNTKRYQAGYYPNLVLFGSYVQNWQGDDFNQGIWFPNSLVGAKVSVPIFDGFLKKAQIQRARLEKEQALLQLDNLERGIAFEISTAKTAYNNALATYERQTESLELAELIYNDATIKYQEGVGSSVELIQAEQALFETQRNRTQAMYNLLVAKKDLQQAFGYN